MSDKLCSKTLNVSKRLGLCSVELPAVYKIHPDYNIKQNYNQC